jgi:predicted Zn-dependent peptidase
VAERFSIRQLANGMTLLGQQMDQVSSAAVTLAVPNGSLYDPPAMAGAAAVASEWSLRGAGDRDTRQLNDALDSLGCQHQESVRSEHTVVSAAQLGRNLHPVMAILADLVRRPRLEDATFAPSRALIEQDLESLEDEPARKCNLLLRERFYPCPLGRCVYGTAETLAAIEPATLRRHATGLAGPQGSILSVAGEIDWPAFCDQAEAMFGDWAATPVAPPPLTPPAGGVQFLAKESAQTHIAMAHLAAPVGHEMYYATRMAEMVLSGGASSRLHTEVREKRGLVYHVSSSYHSLKNHAGMFTYAGMRPDLAQETFEVTIGELRRLAKGIEPDEMTRSQTQLRSSLVMQGESTSARANALASDWYHLGRLRSLEEVSHAIEAVTIPDVLDYLRAFPAENFTVLVIGPKPLDTGSLGAAK